MFAVRNGDINKLGLLFERYNIKLYNYFMKLTFNSQTSEDLVQEVFRKLIKHRHTYRGDGVFTTWMFQIAHNSYYDHARRRKTNQSIEDNEIDIADETNIHRSIEDDEDKRLLKQAISNLPDAEREILVLRIYQNMKYKEIATLMDTPLGTVKARAHHGIKRLKTLYNDLYR